MKKIDIRFITLLTIIFAAAFSRIIPHPPNFSPMEAITLFAAAHFSRRWQALLIPFVAMWLSSLFIDNVIYASGKEKFLWVYPGFHWQYLSYVLIALIGFSLMRQQATALRVAAGGLSAAMLFFVLTNFGVWVDGSLYPQTVQGLIACYAAALPFFRGTLMGLTLYLPVLFGGFHLLQKRYPLLRASRVAA